MKKVSVMISKIILTFAMVSTGLILPSVVLAAAEVGKPAPAFSVKNFEGKDVTLESLKGQWVVLEWYNKDCPYVKKHYGSNNMQKLQKQYTDKKVNWFMVISSKEGAQGYLTPEQAKANFAEQKAAATGLLLDSSGIMGKAYGAKVTPHMYVIDPKGTVVYAGAIDDNDSASPKVIEKSKNYVVAALDSAMAGKPVEKASTKPYGCSVKY